MGFTLTPRRPRSTTSFHPRSFSAPNFFWRRQVQPEPNSQEREHPPSPPSPSAGTCHNSHDEELSTTGSSLLEPVTALNPRYIRTQLRWRQDAMTLREVQKDCLLGAVCLSITDHNGDDVGDEDSARSPSIPSPPSSPPLPSTAFRASLEAAAESHRSVSTFQSTPIPITCACLATPSYYDPELQTPPPAQWLYTQLPPQLPPLPLSSHSPESTSLPDTPKTPSIPPPQPFITSPLITLAIATIDKPLPDSPSSTLILSDRVLVNRHPFQPDPVGVSSPAQVHPIITVRNRSRPSRNVTNRKRSRCRADPSPPLHLPRSPQRRVSSRGDIPPGLTGSPSTAAPVPVVPVVPLSTPDHVTSA